MKNLTLDEMEKVQGGDATECGTALVAGVLAGGIIGSGLGAVAGAVIVGTSSSCLDWW
ncbi:MULTISPECIES: Blp family class II bacteriocin [Pontibacter]|uniref:Bacteriocin n=1 Tax=Pontibacter mangrovi TaxID=2589816 RepID=A0A501VYZ4_9BACT|nr:Blp family class II bacteriocin [Pontibacter mangrovi]TPE39727.1 hypothetical protein FJM65_20805 [Pontibacter mangrovi]